MAQEETGADRTADLRERADELLQGQPVDEDSLSSEEVQRLVHELRAHQIELEMQNEELRRTEHELEVSRDRYSDLYDLAPIGYVTVDEGGLILEANLTGAEFLGIERGRLIGRPLSRFVAREDQEAFYLHRRQTFQSRLQQTCEIRMAKADGTAFLAQMTSIFACDGDGNHVCRTAITDVSEREKAEEQLRFQAQLLANVRESVVATDLEGHVIYWGKGAEALYGYRAEEVMGKLVTLVSKPQDKEKELERVLHVQARSTWSGQYAQRRQDGTCLWVDSVVSLVTNPKGQPLGYIGIDRDISERVQTEQEIERLARFPSENPNPVLRIRQDGTILYGNQASAVLLNAWGRQIGQRLPDTWQREVSSALKSGSPVTIETEAGDRTFMLTLAPLVEQGYANAYGLDITKRKQAEAALRQALEFSQWRQREVSALLVASRAILNQREFVDTARSIFDACKDLLGAAAGYLALLSKDGTKNEVQFLDSGGLPCAVDPDLAMPVRGLRAEAYRTGNVVHDNCFSQSEWTQYLPAGHLGLDSVLFAPLVIEGKPAGLLGLANKPGGFTQEDARIAMAFGELAAIALHNSRTLASLANSEQRFRSVAETANDAIISADGSGRIILWNRAAQLMFGYTADETVGRSVDMLMPEPLRAHHQQSMQAFTATGELGIAGQTVEACGLRKNGSQFPLAISLATWTAEGETFSTAVLRDITDRKQAEETLHRHAGELEARVAERTAELAQANERLQREIAERVQAEEDLLRLNQELETLNQIAITLSLSSDLKRVLDATLGKVLATVKSDAGMIHLLDQEGRVLSLVAHRGLAPEMVQAAETVLPDNPLIQQTIQSGEPVTADRVEVPATRDPECTEYTTIYAFASVPLRSQDSVLGVLCICSERPRKLSSREVQLLSAIGHQVGVAVENARLTAEAAEMEVLQELDRLRSELIANVSHELRTPLGLIKAFCSSLMMEDVELPREAQLDFMHGIDEEADKLEKIVTNLLSLSRMESGRLYLNRYPADVGQLIREVVAMMKAQSPRHHLVYGLASESLVATIDPRSIEQVMCNLLDNAIKYSPAGGTVTVHSHREDAQLVVAVQDEGIGIRAEDLERIFERFYRVDNAVGRSAGGVGLGLAVCRSIVEAHGGRIWVESTLGQGSTFRFTLPVGASDQEGDDPSAS